MLRIALPPEPIDDGITVAEAARIIGADEATVRVLVHACHLEGWRVGKGRKGTALRSIRVSRSSCIEYRERNRVGTPQAVDGAAAPSRPPRARRPAAAHLEALASLRALGVKV